MSSKAFYTVICRSSANRALERILFNTRKSLFQCCLSTLNMLLFVRTNVKMVGILKWSVNGNIRISTSSWINIFLYVFSIWTHFIDRKWPVSPFYFFSTKEPTSLAFSFLNGWKIQKPRSTTEKRETREIKNGDQFMTVTATSQLIIIYIVFNLCVRISMPDFQIEPYLSDLNWIWKRLLAIFVWNVSERNIDGRLEKLVSIVCQMHNRGNCGDRRCNRIFAFDCWKASASDGKLNCVCNSRISFVISRTFPLQLSEIDDLPLSICTSCKDFLLQLNTFSERCVQADSLFNDLLRSDAPCDDAKLHALRIEYGLDVEEVFSKAKISQYPSQFPFQF